MSKRMSTINGNSPAAQSNGTERLRRASLSPPQ